MRRSLISIVALCLAGPASASVPMGGLAHDRLSASAPATVTGGSQRAPSSVTSSAVASSGGGMATAVVGVVGAGPGADRGASSAPVSGAAEVSVVAQATADSTPSTSPSVATEATVVTVEPGVAGAEPAVVSGPDAGELPAPVLDAETEAEVAEYQRLFGGEAAAAPGEAVEMETSSSLWFWPLLLLVLGGVWVWRKRGGTLKDTKDEIQIVGRASLGREGSLAVVEVEDNDGRHRRLLIGYGGGAPRLVADLADSDGGYMPTGGADTTRNAAAWSSALDQAQGGLETRSSHDELIANVLADREQVRRSLGDLPRDGDRAGVRRRAYRGTMA